MPTIQYVNSKNESLIIGESMDFSLIELSGLCPPKANIITKTRTGFDGSSVVSAVVNTRNLVMVLQMSTDVEANRLKVYDIFRIKQKGILTYTSELIQAQIEGYVESVEVLPMSWPVKVVISLICPQPYFEALQDILIDIASIEDALSYPLELFSSGIEIGIIHPSQALNVLNPGDISIGMTIKFQAIGEVINPKIINTLSLQSIELEIVMQAGDIIQVTTEVGKKKIELIHAGETTNIFNTLVMGSVFMQLESGDNVLYTTSETGSTFLLTQVIFRPKYSGV